MESKTEFVKKTIAEFFEIGPEIDGYEIQGYLNEWVQILKQFVPLAHALNIMMQLFFRKVPRFMPGFVELAKVAKEIRARKSPELLDILHKALKRGEEFVRDEKEKEMLRKLATEASIDEVARLALKCE